MTRLYSQDHVWVEIEGGVASVGVTDCAQRSLGDIVYIEMPKAGTRVQAGRPCCVIESVKSATDVISPVSGTVVETNGALARSPETVNAKADTTWILKVSGAEPAAGLLGEADYRARCG